ncbi:RagB/SusD family nutrient uptake outer membrane protein [Desertivirga xinjiangensis]|uniref:RagB/SusD family nutrient uptake outer membrane protein n=1 Tax=Desertivirga xinjiangensis TaxID=539206 RepID=UPI0021095504|nr:RagB/SusD family nutrient uptake outer membrane protein [Pedobacter xinjiangensis]
MKAYNLSFLALLVTGTLLASCGKDFLDLKPISGSSLEGFYQNAADIDQAVSGAYDALQSHTQYGQYFMYFMEVSSDNSKTESITNSGGIYGDFDLFRTAASNIILSDTWQSCYNGIQRCNIVLNRIDKIEMDEKTKENRRAEVKFIRALTYFNLVRIWGPVSLVTEEVSNPFDAFKFGRNPTSEVYTQIIKDLRESADVLPPSYTAAKDVGRVTKGAAQALLGKVLLTTKDYDAAAIVLKTVIDSKTYGLLGNYADVFKVANKNNKESIFEIQFLKGGLNEGSSFANIFAPAGSTVLTGGIGPTMGNNMPTQNLVDAYTALDSRKSASIDRLNDGRYYVKKYMDIPFQANDASSNFIVLRYADVLLMYAEALNELKYIANGDALFYLNVVKFRAGLTKLDAMSLPDQNTFRDAIFAERRLELAFENHRWFDLLRSGKAIDVLNASSGGFTVQSHQVLFPVPQSQINTNPGIIYQNQYYN